jgi:hypothetical protein
LVSAHQVRNTGGTAPIWRRRHLSGRLFTHELPEVLRTTAVRVNSAAADLSGAPFDDSLYD